MKKAKNIELLEHYFCQAAFNLGLAYGIAGLTPEQVESEKKRFLEFLGLTPDIPN